MREYHKFVGNLFDAKYCFSETYVELQSYEDGFHEELIVVWSYRPNHHGRKLVAKLFPNAQQVVILPSQAVK